MKTKSVFFNKGLKKILQSNIDKYDWAKQAKERILKAAQPWMSYSDDEIWKMMFGPTIHRAWMVWSDGYCPACKKDVRMYNWKIDAFNKPWKVACPNCNELFPKNDFYRFYLSGLDKKGVFQPDLANRTLLYNTDHPDPDDPLHKFGVDDGEGYVKDGNRWRFIGAYLIYGQWKQLIVNGITNLCEAYAVSGNLQYAHKAAILLDRIADLYPDFDFAKQGSAYETSHGSGYVSTWHDACKETRQLALSYDLIFDALPEDAKLVSFLSKKAKMLGLKNPKTSFKDIQRNIEKGILEHAVQHPKRIHNNYPRTEAAIILIKTILEQKDEEKQIQSMLDTIIEKAVNVDGVTGEKGLAGYAAYVINGLALLLAQFDRIDPDFLRKTIKKHPGLKQTYKFHIDTYCLNRYYPRIGDTGAFSLPFDKYVGVQLEKKASMAPSMFTFLYRLYQITQEPEYIQTIFRENGQTTDKLPYDLFCADVKNTQQDIKNVIKNHGTIPVLDSVNKQSWHLALLRSGSGDNERVLWTDYDSGGRHAHADGLNIGLFAYGLDLLPDFGYPPVQYGGWNSQKANWYKMSAAHNTVVVDGKNHKTNSEPIAGKTSLWAIGDKIKVICVKAPALTDCDRFERTLLLIDRSDNESYIVDLFRVSGGLEHAKYTGSTFGDINTKGLNLSPLKDYKEKGQMKDFKTDTPKPGWYVDWKIKDKFNLLKENNRDIHLRYTGLTEDAEVMLCKSWVVLPENEYTKPQEDYIPRLIVKRKATQSDFLSILEPYEDKPFINNIKRLQVDEKLSNHHVVLQVTQENNTEDLIILKDSTEDTINVPSLNLSTDATCCVIRKFKNQKRIFACNFKSLHIDGIDLCYEKIQNLIELKKNTNWEIINGHTS